MLTIKVLGSGCPNCRRLEEYAKIAFETIKAERPEAEAVFEKITDFTKFIDYGLMATPGLVINDKLVSSGKIPGPEAIAAWMREAL